MPITLSRVPCSVVAQQEIAAPVGKEQHLSTGDNLATPEAAEYLGRKDLDWFLYEEADYRLTAFRSCMGAEFDTALSAFEHAQFEMAEQCTKEKYDSVECLWKDQFGKRRSSVIMLACLRSIPTSTAGVHAHCRLWFTVYLGVHRCTPAAARGLKRLLFVSLANGENAIFAT